MVNLYQCQGTNNKGFEKNKGGNNDSKKYALNINIHSAATLHSVVLTYSKNTNTTL